MAKNQIRFVSFHCKNPDCNNKMKVDMDKIWTNGQIFTKNSVQLNSSLAMMG
jgi:hypothetical protein